jgi:hypothetical protein
VQQDDRLAVRLRGPDVHVRHGERLALGLELIALDGMRIVEVGEERVGVDELKGGTREQERYEHSLEGHHSQLSLFCFRCRFLSPGSGTAGSMMTGLPTVGGSFAGLSFLMARWTAFAALAVRDCRRGCFGMGHSGVRYRKGNVTPRAKFLQGTQDLAHHLALMSCSA